jgi:serine/threonine-protein kinase
MNIKQKLKQIITLSSSYFVVLFVLSIFFSLSITNTLFYISQLAMAQMQSHREPKSSFLVYENPTYRTRIQYPTDWKKVQPQSCKGESDKDIVEFKLPSQTRLPRDLAAVCILIHNLPTHNIVDQFTIFFDKSSSQKILLNGFILSHFTSILTKKLPNFDFIKSESDATNTVAGNPARKIVYEYREGQDDIKVMELLTVEGDKGYIIRYTTEAARYSDYLPIIQKMIDSFQVK